MPDPSSLVAARQIGAAFEKAFDSPSKELGSYIADKIRYLRYKSLLKIVEDAEKKAKERGLLLKMPPIKFFLPFCEGASLEEGGLGEAENERQPSVTDIKSMWSNLLIESCGQYDSRHNVFTRILKEITSNEIRFLKRLVEESRADTYWRGSTLFYEDSSIISVDHYAHFAAQIAFASDREISNLVVRCFECPGYLFYSVGTGNGKAYGKNEETSLEFESEWYHSGERRGAHTVLLSLGLIKEFSTDYMYFDGDRYLEMTGVHLTELGVDFVKTCSDFNHQTSHMYDLVIDTEKNSISIVRNG